MQFLRSVDEILKVWKEFGKDIWVPFILHVLRTQVEALLIKNDLSVYVNGTNVAPERGSETRETWIKNDKRRDQI